jgi:hypothetical protein
MYRNYTKVYQLRRDPYLPTSNKVHGVIRAVSSQSLASCLCVCLSGHHTALQHVETWVVPNRGVDCLNTVFFLSFLYVCIPHSLVLLIYIYIYVGCAPPRAGTCKMLFYGFALWRALSLSLSLSLCLSVCVCVSLSLYLIEDHTLQDGLDTASRK